MKPWNKIPVNECGQRLIPLPLNFRRLEPHPYIALGAPYQQPSDPWRLRVEVVNRLIKAQYYLQTLNSEMSFSIFDAWRPLAVQEFMVDYSFKQECISKGLKLNSPEDQLAVDNLRNEVYRFWAEPSVDENKPPPHSTGAAVDLTLSDINGVLLDMGGLIDQIGSISSPDYYLEKARKSPKSCVSIWHDRRMILRESMLRAGFVQHPNEWWHFSFGDQLWAWISGSGEAIYGSC